jgi:hypothetical protein
MKRSRESYMTLAILKRKKTPEDRREYYAILRDRYSFHYQALERIRAELHTLEEEMLKRGELEEGDIA